MWKRVKKPKEFNKEQSSKHQGRLEKELKQKPEQEGLSRQQHRTVADSGQAGNPKGTMEIKLNPSCRTEVNMGK